VLFCVLLLCRWFIVDVVFRYFWCLACYVFVVSVYAVVCGLFCCLYLCGGGGVIGLVGCVWWWGCCLWGLGMGLGWGCVRLVRFLVDWLFLGILVCGVLLILLGLWVF